MRVFLDANILFSAALGGDSFDLLWRLGAGGKIRLCSSPYCIAEAEANLARKRPAALRALAVRLAVIDVVPDAAAPTREQPPAGVPEKDAPVWWAARAADADVLVTGDVRHFGALMERRTGRPRVRTVRAFLLEGPAPPRPRGAKGKR